MCRQRRTKEKKKEGVAKTKFQKIDGSPTPSKITLNTSNLTFHLKGDKIDFKKQGPTLCFLRDTLKTDK